MIAYSWLGLLNGVFIYCLTFFLAVSLLRRNNLNKRDTLFFVYFSFVLYFIGAIFSWRYSLTHVSDSQYWYFGHTILHYAGIGTQLLRYVAGLIKYFITGNSYLGLTMIFAGISFLGGVLYLILFHELYRCLQQHITLKKHFIRWTSLCLLCWPSLIFFTASVNKDALMHFFIPLCLFSVYRFRDSVRWVLMLVFMVILIGLFRINVAMVIIGAGLMMMFFDRRISVQKKTLLFIGCGVVLIFLLLYVQGHYFNFSHYSIESFGNAIIQYQVASLSGDSFGVLAATPGQVFLFLPLTMFANLFLPLINFSKSTFIVSAIENWMLLGLCVAAIFKVRYWRFLGRERNIFIFMLFYVLIGLAALALFNTNLGTAMRQKLMYTPALFIVLGMLFSIPKRVQPE